MAWTATESFDSYTNGATLAAASGGSGWNGNWTIGVGTWIATNAQSVSASNSGSQTDTSSSAYINRTITSITSGSMVHYIRASATGLSEYINLSTAGAAQGAASRVLGGFENLNIIFYDNTTQRTVLATYAANTWYKVTIVFDGVANTYTVQIDSGTVFGPYVYSFGGTGAITNVQFYRGGGLAQYFFDSIAPVATATSAKFALLGVG